MTTPIHVSRDFVSKRQADNAAIRAALQKGEVALGFVLGFIGIFIVAGLAIVKELFLY